MFLCFRDCLKSHKNLPRLYRKNNQLQLFLTLTPCRKYHHSSRKDVLFFFNQNVLYFSYFSMEHMSWALIRSDPLKLAQNSVQIWRDTYHIKHMVPLCIHVDCFLLNLAREGLAFMYRYMYVKILYITLLLCIICTY